MKKTHLAGWGLIAVFFCGMISATAASPNVAVKPCSDAKNKMDDVYCIGDRRVAHRSMISEAKEIAIGKKYAEQIDRSAKLVKDPVITEYVNRVEQNIAENSDAKVPITVRIINSPQINAFTLPGGFIYVNTGLLKAASSEAQLAGVLAHETGHVAARHWASSMTKQTLLQYAMIPLIFTPMSYPVYIGLSEGLNMGLPIAFLKFSRDDEQQADFLGLQYMWKAGYDPNAYLAMFAKIIQDQHSDPGSVPSIFMDHPPTKDRIIKAEEEIKNILPKRKEYLVSTSEFQNVKAGMTTLLSAMKRNKKDKNAPTLIRREPSSQPASTGKSSGQSKGNDQPPVLRRRN
ncbi:MAG TPA: M48 family metallopeptidase [Terriglobia bacterium]|nr:M48 family metallopeptidase [Terriglobia bacterium]